MLPTAFILSDQQRQIQTNTKTKKTNSFTKDVIPFLHNIIFQYTNPLPFEAEPHSIQTIPIHREHADSYL